MLLFFTDLPKAATLLGGFVLAHAVWSVSDTSPAELLAPLAIIERSGQRTLQRFEAQTQVAAIENGKRAIAEAMRTSDAWAFAREGALRVPATNPITSDVIVVDFWAKAMPTSATAYQRFERSTPKRPFRLIGDPEIAIDGKMLDAHAAKSIVEALLRGVASHSQVAPLWKDWRGKISPHGA